MLFGNLCPADSWADFKGLRPDSCPMKVWPALCFCFYFFCLFMIWLWWDLLWSRLIIFPHKLLSLRSAESKPVFVFARLRARLGLTAATNHRRLSGHVHPGGATVHQSGAHQPVSGALCIGTLVHCATVGSWRGAVVRPIGEQPVEGRPAGITVSRM